jgi:hypothetical protein
LAIIARDRPARIVDWTLAATLALASAAVYGLALWRAPGWRHANTPQDRYNARVLVISVGGAIVVGTGLPKRTEPAGAAKRQVTPSPSVTSREPPSAGVLIDLA